MPGKNFRLVASAAVTALSVAALAACGSGSSGAAAGSAETTAAAATASADSDLHAQLPADIQESGVVKLATDAQYPPCESIDAKTKEMVGYEPDLWNAMAAKLGVKIEVSNVAFDSLIPGVQSGRYDMAMECISDNLEREKQVTFVDNAYAMGAVYTLESNTTVTEDPLSLCGLKTAVQQGLDLGEKIETVLSPHCESAGKEPITIQKFPSANAALLALYSGRVDFVLNDLAAAEALQEAAPKPIRFVTNELLEKYYNGMIFNIEDSELQQAFLAALEAIVEDGSYEQIMTQWGLEDLMISEPGINLAESDPLVAPTP